MTTEPEAEGLPAQPGGPEFERLPSAPWILGADARLAAAVELVRAGAPLILVTRADGSLSGCLDPLVVRAAHVGGESPEAPIARLAEAAPPEPALAYVPDPLGGERRLASGPVVEARPELDDSGRPTGVSVRRDATGVRCAIVMAGGRGERLRPVTDELPKPLVDVGGKPLLGHVLDLLAAHGVEEAFVSTRYLAELVEAYLEQRSAEPPRTQRLHEAEALGTAGALGLAQGRVHERFYLINGDVSTSADLTAMAAHHLRSGAVATVGTVRYQWRIPYGVVRPEGLGVASIEEKPLYRFETNAGIYLFEPSVLRDVEARKPADMVELLNLLTGRGDVVSRFPLVESWSDVGTPADLERVRRDSRSQEESP